MLLEIIGQAIEKEITSVYANATACYYGKNA